MTPRTGREVRLLSYPRGEITPEHFATVEVDLPDLAPGQVLVRNTFTSVDPGMSRSFPLAIPVQRMAPVILIK